MISPRRLAVTTGSLRWGVKNAVGGHTETEERSGCLASLSVMSKPSGTNYKKVLLRAAVGFLVAVSLAASVRLLSTNGLSPAVVGEVVVTLYVSALVIYGVFWGRMESRRFRVALYFGVVLWGGERFLSGNESVLTVVLILGGMAMVIRELYFTE